MSHTSLFLVRDKMQESQSNSALKKIKMLVLRMMLSVIQGRNMPVTGLHQLGSQKNKKGGLKQSIHKLIPRQQQGNQEKQKSRKEFLH